MPLVRRGSALIIMPPDLPKGIAMHLEAVSKPSVGLENREIQQIWGHSSLFWNANVDPETRF